jgi:hypothetical protein
MDFRALESATGNPIELRRNTDFWKHCMIHGLQSLDKLLNSKGIWKIILVAED